MICDTCLKQTSNSPTPKYIIAIELSKAIDNSKSNYYAFCNDCKILTTNKLIEKLERIEK